MAALRTADGGQTGEEESLPVDWGIPHLLHDGEFLKEYSFFSQEITVLRYA
jgi:hypothetical protein